MAYNLLCTLIYTLLGIYFLFGKLMDTAGKFSVRKCRH